MVSKNGYKQVLPSWVYNGDDFGSGERAVVARNVRGTNGRCAVTPAEPEEGKRSTTRLVIDIDGIRFEVPRPVAEELNAALCTALRPYAGMSLFQRYTEELDTIIDRMMTGGEAEDGRDPGRAEAMCWMLALMRNSYLPDFEQEKKLAMDRWNHINLADTEEWL